MVLHRRYEEKYRGEPTRDDVLELERGRPRRRVLTSYEVFMEEENLPIHRGLGVYDCRQLPRAPWKRLGGQGTFIELEGQAGQWGMYLVEVPAGKVLNPERHMYEEVFVVIEGRGSTEVWREGSSKKQTFEWQPWSRFAIPLNVWHRLVNATSSPALAVVFTTATSVMNLFANRHFVFENPFEFVERYDESEDYFKPEDELIGNVRGLAVVRTNLIPDLAHCYIPLANTRGAGHKRLEAWMAGNTFFAGNHIAEYPVGRYSVAHYHSGGKVILCLRGKGYSYNWPVELGKRPWEAGNGHLVRRQDYVPGGLVTAAPGGGNWWHQHFSCGKDVLREMSMGYHGRITTDPESEIRRKLGEEVDEEFRSSIPYNEEDPFIRKEYEETLKKEGAEFTMPEWIYHEKKSGAFS